MIPDIFWILIGMGVLVFLITVGLGTLIFLQRSSETLRIFGEVLGIIVKKEREKC